MRNYLYLLVSLLLISAIFVDAPVQASRRGGGHAGQMKNARMNARANRQQARAQKFKAGNQSLSQSDAVKTKGNRNRDNEVENDETHWVGHDRAGNRQRRRNQNRTETVDNNETISINGQRSTASSFSQSDAMKARGNRNRVNAVENDETHWVGHDRSKNRQRRLNQNRTETVDKNETISKSPQASGTTSLMEEEGIFYFRKKKGQRRLRNSNLQ